MMHIQSWVWVIHCSVVSQLRDPFITSESLNVLCSDRTNSRGDLRCECSCFTEISFCDCAQAMAPDLRRKVDETRRARLAFEEGMKQQQNAQVGPSFGAVSCHRSRFVLADRPGVRKTRLGRSTKVISTLKTMAHQMGATAVGTPYTLEPFSSSQLRCAKQCQNGHLIVQ